MPGRWPGHVPKFSGTAWNVPTARALDEFLRNMHKGMSNLQRTPVTPTKVEGNVAASVGTGPAPAMDNHVHDLNTTGTPVSVATTNAQGTGSGVALTNHQHRLGIVSAKGDIIVSNGTNPIALSVGANDYVLAGSSSAGAGVAWSSIAKDARLLAWLGL